MLKTKKRVYCDLNDFHGFFFFNSVNNTFDKIRSKHMNIVETRERNS